MDASVQREDQNGLSSVANISSGGIERSASAIRLSVRDCSGERGLCLGPYSGQTLVAS